jgi:hypothetical protein
MAGSGIRGLEASGSVSLFSYVSIILIWRLCELVR